MKHQHTRNSYRSLLLTVLLLATAVTACDNQVNVAPAVIAFPDITSPVEAIWTVRISGTLAAEQGSCIKAMILFDAAEIGSSRVRCQEPDGCDELELSGVVTALAGTHTIAFKVLRQAEEVENYLGTGFVEVSRADLNLGSPVILDLRPTRESLQEGESVIFEIDLRDFE